MHEPRSPRPAESSAALWAPLARFIAAEDRLGRWAEERPGRAVVYEFIRFGVKQAWACLFGGLMVALILATHRWYPAGAALARYDFMFLAALAGARRVPRSPRQRLFLLLPDPPSCAIAALNASLLRP